MHRGKKIILLSHCILNVNSKVYGIGNYEGSLEELMIPLIKKGYGFIQLPCPELLSCGLKRWGQVKDQYETPYFYRHCKSLLSPIIDQVLDYSKNGYKIVSCIGIDRSPSCGVNITCRAHNWGREIDESFSVKDATSALNWVEEKGVFMELFEKLLLENDLKINFLAIDESNPKASVEKILKELE